MQTICYESNTCGRYKGANLNDKDQIGHTPLFYAAIQGHADKVNLLLSKGANVRDKDMHGKIALMYASELGLTKIVKLLTFCTSRGVQLGLPRPSHVVLVVLGIALKP